MDTSKAVREMMLKRDKSCGEIAEQIKYTKQSYSRLLRNGINKIDVLRTIANTMEYDVEIILRDRIGEDNILIK